MEKLAAGGQAGKVVCDAENHERAMSEYVVNPATLPVGRLGTIVIAFFCLHSPFAPIFIYFEVYHVW